MERRAEPSESVVVKNSSFFDNYKGNQKQEGDTTIDQPANEDKNMLKQEYEDISNLISKQRNKGLIETIEQNALRSHGSHRSIFEEAKKSIG